jgi:hypothetical protein
LWNGGDWFIRKLAREDPGTRIAEYLGE